MTGKIVRLLDFNSGRKTWYFVDHFVLMERIEKGAHNPFHVKRGRDADRAYTRIQLTVGYAEVLETPEEIIEACGK